MASVIEARNLSRSFLSEETEVRALKDINIVVEEGEFTIVMGQSGSGKSTLLYSLSGLDRPTSGEIELHRRRIDTLSERELSLMRRGSVGFVFQNINLVPNLTIEENILVAGYLGKGRRMDIVSRARRLMEELDIAGVADHMPGESSGGEQQRAAVARALINEPSILFADEPTGSLNFASGQRILDHLGAINAAGQTIVMVTHDLKAAARGSQILFMRDGSLVGNYRFDASLLPSAENWGEREQRLFTWLVERGW